MSDNKPSRDQKSQEIFDAAMRALTKAGEAARKKRSDAINDAVIKALTEAGKKARERETRKK